MLAARRIGNLFGRQGLSQDELVHRCQAPLGGYLRILWPPKGIKDAVPDPNFMLVARIEALIAGHGPAEASERAHAYAAAGADAILIHSRQSHADEVLSFAEAWGQQLPVLVVPTKYYRTPVEAYRRAQISTVIWANHNLRAAVASMRKVCNRILHEESIAGIEHEVASLEEVFGLLRYNELAAAERKYLPERRPAAVDK